MDRVYVQNIAGSVGKNITIKGWIYNRRSSGKLHFLLVRDATDMRFVAWCPEQPCRDIACAATGRFRASGQVGKSWE